MNETAAAVITITAAVPGVGLLTIGVLRITHVDRRIRARGFLYMVAGGGVQLAAAVIAGSTPSAAVHAAVVAVGLYGWWINGGGDGMRRAWKNLRSRIPGRLAPQPI